MKMWYGNDHHDHPNYDDNDDDNLSEYEVHNCQTGGSSRVAVFQLDQNYMIMNITINMMITVIAMITMISMITMVLIRLIRKRRPLCL